MAKDEKVSVEKAVRDIRRETRRKYSAEEKIRIVLEGLRGEESIVIGKASIPICTTSGARNS